MLTFLVWVAFGQSWHDLGSTSYKVRQAAHYRLERWALLASPILGTEPRNEEQRFRVELIEQRAESQRAIFAVRPWIRWVLTHKCVSSEWLADWILSHHHHVQAAWCEAIDEVQDDWRPPTLAWVEQTPYLRGSKAADLTYVIERFRSVQGDK